MYESRFGITGPPFQLGPDVSFYFDSRQHHGALAELRRGLSQDAGFVVVSGEIGAGKTTLIRTLLAELDPGSLAISQVVSSQLCADEVLVAACIGFGIRSKAYDDPTSTLLRFLLRLDKESRRAVLVIDEAQNLHHDAFDQLRLLATRRRSRPLPILVFFVGQPELRSIIDVDALAPLRAQVNASCHLGPIDRDETGAYIEHRLRKVGWTGMPHFEPGAYDEIFRWTGGIPRRINLLCNRLLLSRFLACESAIGVATIADTALELRAEVGELQTTPACVGSVMSTGAAPAPARSEEVDHPQAQRAAPAAHAAHAAILCVAAGHADHIKAAALMRTLVAHSDLSDAKLVRIHDNDALSLTRALFEGFDFTNGVIELGIAEGHFEVNVADVANAFRGIVERMLPKAVVVFDGSEIALACATAAGAVGIPVVHVGAGLRAGSRVDGLAARKPTDHLADLFYTTEAQASATLEMEGVSPERVHFVGNLLIDAVQMASWIGVEPDFAGIGACAEPSIPSGRNGFGLVALHHPVNIGDRRSLTELLTILRDVSRDIPLVWPVHARVDLQLRKYRLDRFHDGERISRLPWQPYPDYVALLRNATCVLTDSWSTQEEAAALGVPCITVGAFPERANACSSVAVGYSRALATRAVWECTFNGGRSVQMPPLWDGRTAARIAGHLSAWLAGVAARHPPS